VATISDVAARAGVSTATVSRALNGKSTVDPTLAALIISDVENPFFTAIARGVEDLAQRSGYSVVLCNSDENEDKERRYIEVALQERVAGVVLSPTGRSTNVEGLRRQGTPLVAVDRPLQAAEGDQVLVDTRHAAAEATRHLLAGGYRRVGCLTGPPGVRTAEDRLAGYTEVVGEENVLFRRGEYRAEGARLATLDLLDEPSPPDALLVANSTMAIGVLEALSARGLRPGSDVGIVSFDDAPWTTLVDPPLTVVAQPAYEVGRVAAQLLLARITDSSRDATTTTLEARLIVRKSSRR
jgi:LacI family transcriptional regulator